MKSEVKVSMINQKKYVILHLKKELARYESELIELEQLL